MRLDWIFLPRENPCAKFYIIIILLIIIIKKKLIEFYLPDTSTGRSTTGKIEKIKRC